MTDLEKLAIDYIIAREQFNNLSAANAPEEMKHIYEIDMFKHLVNLANYVKFNRPEFKEAMGTQE